MNLKRPVNVIGETQSNRLAHLNWSWEQCGNGFTDINKFLDTIHLDKFRPVAEERKQLAALIKELQPKASNRQIARTLGVADQTVGRDLATNVAPDERKDERKQADSYSKPSEPATNVAPELSGAAAAKLADRKATVKKAGSLE